jgi:hypothetical protein
MDLADVYRIFHPTSTQYTFFLAAHRTFSETDHILGHKASLSKYKKIEKLNSSKIYEPIKKWATELNGTFSKEEIQMAKKHMKNAHHLWP